MIRILTAGESHGKALTVIVEGFPSNLPISKEYVDNQLRRRQMGYGRGGRMKIETDKIEINSGIRFGKTLGSPIAFNIFNSDWQNWLEPMSHTKIDKDIEKITIPRPGHADLTGISKYNFDDIRNSIERSSARETAARVAGSTLAKRFLEELGITVGSYVESIGDIYPSKSFLDKLYKNKLPKDLDAQKLADKADKSDVRVLEKDQEEKIIEKIKLAKKNGDTLGGNIVVIATGVPVGLGTYMHFDKKLDAAIAFEFMSINAIKGVEIGSGFNSADLFGSKSHDEIIMKNNIITRKTNRAGGIEGGISTGLPIIVKAAMKPIATLMQPIQTIDLKGMKSVKARRERSDFVAVPACGVIGEAALAWVLAKFMLDKFGGDSIEETKNNYKNFNDSLLKNIQNNFNK
ncbi:MAG: chorismate synthase [Ignavibacteriales bacterium]|nr:chorismate synthase [Ignavibacteriales bacterium]MCB9209684.1 chorismate synthase [Ignavibacteriales bacterium]